MKNTVMQEALSRKLGKGLEITIQVQPQENQDTDLAPPGEENPGQPVAELPEPAPEPEQEQQDVREALMGQMSETDVEDLRARKPRSLMERAKKAALEKK